MPEITAIKPQKRDPERVSIDLDGAFALGITRDLLHEFDLHVGTILSEDDLCKLQGAERRTKAYQGALAFLAYRERSVKEVRDWCWRKDYGDLADGIINDLISRDYLSNERFATLFAREKSRLQNWGPGRLRSELIKKGIASDLIAEVLDELDESVDFAAGARELIQKRYDRLKRPNLKDKKRFWAFLQRKGFKTSTIRNVLDAYEFTADSD